MTENDLDLDSTDNRLLSNDQGHFKDEFGVPDPGDRGRKVLSSINEKCIIIYTYHGDVKIKKRNVKRRNIILQKKKPKRGVGPC